MDTAPDASVSSAGRSAPVQDRRDRRIAALQAQLRQQGAAIEAYRVKLRHATERAEADERLLAAQAELLVRLTRDLRTTVDQLHAVVEEAGDDAGKVPS